MNLPDFSSLRGVQCSERHIQLHYPGFYYHLQTLYRDPDISFQEKMYLEELLNLARLGVMRYWNLRMKDNDETKEKNALEKEFRN